MNTLPIDSFSGPVLSPRAVFDDERGSLSELFSQPRCATLGITVDFVQDNISHSKSGVIRGLHYQHAHPQAKLITVLRGSILDVGLDLRRESNTFGKWFAVEMSAKNALTLFLPVGFAHGFAVTEGPCEVYYKCSDIYHADDQFGVLYSDPSLGIDWPLNEPIVSSKDRDLPVLAKVPESALF